jgi:hypothetical protein
MIRGALIIVFVYLCACLVAVAASGPPPKPCVHAQRVQSIKMDVSKYPNIVDHIRDAQRAGYPRVLTINRLFADERRDKLLNQRVNGHLRYPTKRGMDRDEFAPASLRDTVKADVRWVPSGENRSAGASMGNQMSRWCDGVRVRFRFVP